MLFAFMAILTKISNAVIVILTWKNGTGSNKKSVWDPKASLVTVKEKKC